MKSLIYETRRKVQCVLGGLVREVHGEIINLGSVWLMKSKIIADVWKLEGI